MSYDVSLQYSDDTVAQVTPHYEGGTICLGGEAFATMSVTYNYAKHFAEVIGEFGIRNLDGMKAIDTIPILKLGVQKLGTERDEDYWKTTPGNAGYALSVMLSWAQQCPNAVWHIN